VAWLAGSQLAADADMCRARNAMSEASFPVLQRIGFLLSASLPAAPGGAKPLGLNDAFHVKYQNIEAPFDHQNSEPPAQIRR